MTSSPWHRLQTATKFVKHPTAHCRTSQQDQHSTISFFLCGDAVQPKCEFISTKMDPTADTHYSSATVSPSFVCRSSGTSGQIHICLSHQQDYQHRRRRHLLSTPLINHQSNYSPHFNQKRINQSSSVYINHQGQRPTVADYRKAGSVATRIALQIQEISRRDLRG